MAYPTLGSRSTPSCGCAIAEDVSIRSKEQLIAWRIAAEKRREAIRRNEGRYAQVGGLFSKLANGQKFKSNWMASPGFACALDAEKFRMAAPRNFSSRQMNGIDKL